MSANFVSMLTFQVRPDMTERFEALLSGLKEFQAAQPGCVSVGFFRRSHTFDGVEKGQPPRMIARTVKCVRYYACWEFETAESCGSAMGRFFDNYSKEINRLLISPFEINSGYSI